MIRSRVQTIQPTDVGMEETKPRAHPRWVPAFACRVRLDAGGRVVEGEAIDLCDAGMRVRVGGSTAMSGLVVERLAVVRLTIGVAHTERRARVVWTRATAEGEEIGLCLTHEPDAQPIRLDLSRIDIDPRAALRIPTAHALRRRVLPLCEWNGRVITACADLHDQAAIDMVGKVFDLPVLPQPVDATELSRAIQRVHGGTWRSAAEPTADYSGHIEQILYAAWLRRASDVHVCPERDGVHIFLRVDGQLEAYRVLPVESHAELISRIKVLAGMNIAERRAPQDGRFSQDLPGDRRVDIRVATLPTNHGERATLRLLAIETDLLTLEHLGMSPVDLRSCLRGLRQPHGMILATGPTGCGKTTSLFAALKEITTRRKVNAIALQEPVEYDIPGISQVDIDTTQKISFAGALRSIMRHDPDVIMVGEIRDAETASIAIKAALTGHIVLATLHTNSAASAVTRLVDMGVERYLMAATLRLVIAQRLVRRLCVYCRSAQPLSAEVAQVFGRPGAVGHALYGAVGCAYCAGGGFSGRIGLFEVLEVDRELQEAIRNGAHEADIEQAARKKDMASLQDDAMDKLLSGATALQPVLEATELGDVLEWSTN